MKNTLNRCWIDNFKMNDFVFLSLFNTSDDLNVLQPIKYCRLAYKIYGFNSSTSNVFVCIFSFVFQRQRPLVGCYCEYDNLYSERQCVGMFEWFKYSISYLISICVCIVLNVYFEKLFEDVNNLWHTHGCDTWSSNEYWKYKY